MGGNWHTTKLGENGGFKKNGKAVFEELAKSQLLAMFEPGFVWLEIMARKHCQNGHKIESLVYEDLKHQAHTYKEYNGEEKFPPFKTDNDNRTF